MQSELPPLTPEELVRALMRAGFVARRRRSHREDWRLARPGGLTRIAIVPAAAGQLSAETVRAILRYAGLAEGELLAALREGELQSNNGPRLWRGQGRRAR